MNICTIIARNYVAHARVLAESFQKVHPEGTCSVLVIDDPSGYIEPAEEPFELLTIDRIGLPDPARMAAAYDVMELSTAVKPWLLRHLLDRPGVDSVIYLDPDIQVFSSLEEVVERALRHDVVLTPHFTAPLPRDGRKPSEEDILIAGSYNLGFIALGAGETAHALLDWWSERLENDCLNEPAQGRFVDQRWIDLAPGLWPGIDVLRDTAFNIAYWNLPTREPGRRRGRRLPGGRRAAALLPLQRIRPAAPDRPEQTPEPDRRRPPTRPWPGSAANTRPSCSPTASSRRSAGPTAGTRWPTASASTGRRGGCSGREPRSERSPSPCSAEPGAQRFAEYLRKSESEGAGAAASTATRRPCGTRVRTFAGSSRASSDFNGPAYAGWLHRRRGTRGCRSSSCPPRRPTAVPEPRRARAQTGDQRRRVPELGARRRRGGAPARLGAAGGRGAAWPRSTRPRCPARSPRRWERSRREEYPYDVNLVCVNADMLPVVAAALGRGVLRSPPLDRALVLGGLALPRAVAAVVRLRRRSLGRLRAHRRCAPALSAGTRAHDPDAGRAGAAGGGDPGGARDAGGVLLPLRLRLPQRLRAQEPARARRGVPRAFEPGSGPSLVIKSICGDEFPDEREALAAAVAERPDIHLIEDTIPTGDEERDDRQLRLLRLAAPLGGLRADDGRGDVLRQAGDRDRLLRQPRLHDRGEHPISSPTRWSRSAPARIPTRRTRSGPSRTSIAPRR